MSYREIEWTKVKHPVVRVVAEHANMYLHDVYGMFQLPGKAAAADAACNFSIAIILLCVIDGIARDVYPTRLVKDQEKRFKRLIRDKLYWGSREKGWIDKAEAANQLYLEFRNPLVHELGQDKVSRARKAGFVEPVIGKWGQIDPSSCDIDRIDGLEGWNDDWPTIYEQSDERGSRMKLCDAALYWSVKRMVNDLIGDDSMMAFAEVCQDALQTLEADV